MQQKLVALEAAMAVSASACVACQHKSLADFLLFCWADPAGLMRHAVTTEAKALTFVESAASKLDKRCVKAQQCCSCLMHCCATLWIPCHSAQHHAAKGKSNGQWFVAAGAQCAAWSLRVQMRSACWTATTAITSTVLHSGSSTVR